MARGAGVYPPRREAEGYNRLVSYLDRHVPMGARLFCGALFFAVLFSR